MNSVPFASVLQLRRSSASKIHVSVIYPYIESHYTLNLEASSNEQLRSTKCTGN